VLFSPHIVRAIPWAKAYRKIPKKIGLSDRPTARRRALFTMIKNEAANYLYLGFLCADAIMLEPDGCAHLLKKR
jgi:hypothetical protein